MVADRGGLGWQVYIIEANPRASRTVPFVAKAIGHPVAKYASLLMSGQTLAEIGFTEEPVLNHVAVKEAVLPFDKFAGDFQTLHSDTDVTLLGRGLRALSPRLIEILLMDMAGGLH